jgi:Flp pilus assembly protein TadD
MPTEPEMASRARAHLLRASRLIDVHRPDRAAAEARAALAELPGDPEAHRLLANALRALAGPDGPLDPEAETAAREAVRLDPDSTSALYMLGIILFDERRDDEAAAVAREIVRLAPEWSAGPALLARIEQRARRWPEALELAERTLALDPEDPEGHMARVAALDGLGRTAEKEAAIETALTADPENPYPHYWRGMTLLERGEAGPAEPFLREALRLEPTFEPAQRGLGRALAAVADRGKPTSRAGALLLVAWLVFTLVKVAVAGDPEPREPMALPAELSDVHVVAAGTAGRPRFETPDGWRDAGAGLGVLPVGFETVAVLRGPAGGELTVLRDDAGVLSVGPPGRVSTSYPRVASGLLGATGEQVTVARPARSGTLGGEPVTRFEIRTSGVTGPGIGRDLVVTHEGTVWVVRLRSAAGGFATEAPALDRVARSWAWP